MALPDPLHIILRGDLKIYIKMLVFEVTIRAKIRDMFHVYLNRFEFHFLRLHIIKTNKLCFFVHNGRVLGIAK